MTKELLRKTFDEIVSVPSLRIDDAGNLFLARWKAQAGVEIEIPTGSQMDTSAQEVFTQGVLPCLRSPRDVIRAADNAHRATIRLGADIDTWDLLAIETLRVFYPAIWSAVAEHWHLFAYEKWDTEWDQLVPSRRRIRQLLGDDREEVEKELMLFLKDYGLPTDRESDDPKATLLKRLSPRYATAIFDDPSHEESFSLPFLHAGRLCHPANFDLYYAFIRGRDQVGRSDVLSFLNELATEYDAALATYSRLVSTSPGFLTRLRAAADGIIKRQLSKAVLSAVAFHQFNDPADPFSNSPTLEAARLVTLLAARKPEALDKELTKHFIKECQDPLLMRWVYIWLLPDKHQELPDEIKSAFTTRLEQWTERDLVAVLMPRGFGAFSEVMWAWYHANRASLGRWIPKVVEAHEDALLWTLIAAYGRRPVTDEAPADVGRGFFEHVDKDWLREPLESFSTKGLDESNARHAVRMVRELLTWLDEKPLEFPDTE